MTATPRELVHQTLNFESPGRVPRQMWDLPWAEIHHPEELARIRTEFPPDIISADGCLREQPKTEGDAYAVGRSVDEWGCVFENLQAGIIGEVRDGLIKDWEADADKIRCPREWLTVDVDAVNRQCAENDAFVLAGACPRPWERLQFLRKTEQLYLDIFDPPAAMKRAVDEIHAFYCELLSLWAATDVDGLMFMDDWGSQTALLINPDMWREMFKPLYRDYIEIAHKAGKKALMHSDGNILSIYPDLVEIGLDAVNSQVFCMTPEALAPFAGKITFWGEIDRQHILPEGTTDDIDAAVRRVHSNLWKSGGCIAQCEFGPGAKPENVRQVFQSWNDVVR